MVLTVRERSSVFIVWVEVGLVETRLLIKSRHRALLPDDHFSKLIVLLFRNVSTCCSGFSPLPTSDHLGHVHTVSTPPIQHSSEDTHVNCSRYISAEASSLLNIESAMLHPRPPPGQMLHLHTGKQEILPPLHAPRYPRRTPPSIHLLHPFWKPVSRSCPKRASRLIEASCQAHQVVCTDSSHSIGSTPTLRSV